MSEFRIFMKNDFAQSTAGAQLLHDTIAEIIALGYVL